MSLSEATSSYPEKFSEAGTTRCGWGSGALFFAEKLPNARITAFSNSRTQKDSIDTESRRKALSNVSVVTGNIVDYEFEPESFDRVVSIEASL